MTSHNHNNNNMEDTNIRLNRIVLIPTKQVNENVDDSKVVTTMTQTTFPPETVVDTAHHHHSLMQNNNLEDSNMDDVILPEDEEPLFMEEEEEERNGEDEEEEDDEDDITGSIGLKMAVTPEEPLSKPTYDEKDLEGDSTTSILTKDGIVKSSKADLNQSNNLKEKKQKKNPQMNPKFKDVQETGKWGEMSAKEFYIAITVFVVIIIAVIMVVLFVVVLPEESNSNNNNNNNEQDISIVPAPTKAPTMPPVPMTLQEELALVLAALQESPFTAPLLSLQGNNDNLPHLPDDPNFYQGLLLMLDDDQKEEDTAVTPQQKAISWLLYHDELKDSNQSVLRFAFVSMYFQLGGTYQPTTSSATSISTNTTTATTTTWVSTENWLSSLPLCEWEGINCDSRNVIQEIDWDEKGLIGKLPMELALLSNTGIQSILMSGNTLQGPIVGSVFASIPRLGLLYLDNNALTGTVPVELVTEARLHTLYLQSNQLSGQWPFEFCAENTSLLDFGLDCDKLTCNPDCCTPLECYYSS